MRTIDPSALSIFIKTIHVQDMLSFRINEKNVVRKNNMKRHDNLDPSMTLDPTSYRNIRCLLVLVIFPNEIKKNVDKQLKFSSFPTPIIYSKYFKSMLRTEFKFTL